MALGCLSLSLALVITAQAGQAAQSRSAGIESALIHQVRAGDIKSYYSALYLLAGLKLQPHAVATVLRECHLPRGSLGRLFCSFFAYSRTQDAQAAATFVHAFPSEPKQAMLVFTNATQVIMPNALIVLLGNLATDDDAALVKFLSVAAAADGWPAAQMMEKIQEFERRNPDRVRAARERVQR